MSRLLSFEIRVLPPRIFKVATIVRQITNFSLYASDTRLQSRKIFVHSNQIFMLNLEMTIFCLLFRTLGGALLR